MQSSSTTNRQFGLLIAYVLPGFIALVGVAPLFPTVAQWLRPTANADFGLGPPLYAVLGATAAGLILSCFRWVLLDHAHRRMGVRRPTWDDRRLERVLGGFDYLVQSHFRYYEFCGNTLVALLGTYVLNRVLKTLPFLGLWTDLGMSIVLIVLFVASRDALKNYYTRTGRLTGSDELLEATLMFNGNDHGGGSDKGQTAPKPDPKPQPDPKVNPKPTTPSGPEQGKR